MASGIISLGTSGALTGQLVWSSTSNGTAANSSNVSASIQIKRTNSYTTTGTFDYGINVGGKIVHSSWYGSISNSWITIATLSNTVSHNNDGTGSCYLEAYVNGPSGTSLSGNTVAAKQTVTLDTIPRQASLTSAPNFNDEQNPTITYSNPAGNAVSSLQACIASVGGTVAYAGYRDISKTGSSYTFNLTDAERDTLRKIATSNTLTVTFYVRTIISGVTYYSTLNKTLTIVNASPTLSPIIEDTNSVTVALTGNASKMVKYFSSPEVATRATAYKNATITQHSITNGNKKSTKASDIFNNVDNHIFAFWAKDSRGNEVYKQIDKKSEGNWIDYVRITCNASHNNPTTDGKMNLYINGNYWNGNFGAVANQLTLQYRMAVVGQTFGDWVTTPTTLEGNTYNTTVQFEGLDYQTTYKFEVRALDKLETTPAKYFEVQTAPVFDWGKNDFRFNVDAHGWFSHKVKALPAGDGDAYYWRELEAGYYWYNGDNNNVGGMPNKWGILVKTTYDSEFNVIYYTQPEGAVFRRSGNISLDSGWASINTTKVLYENSSGSNGTITLNDSASNYSYLMIYWKSTYNSTRYGVETAPNSAPHFCITTTDIDVNNPATIYRNTAMYAINGKTITFEKTNTYAGTSPNVFYITKVVGYR